jgi:uncharacterized protein YbjT (DUF2867 family)
MILVTGATGTVGREVVRLLVEAGARVRAMTRAPSKAKLPSSVEVVRGDFDDAPSLAAALKGADKLFLLAVGPRIPQLEAHAARTAKERGVKHIVKLSTYGVQNPSIAIAKWHLEAERAVEAAGVAWTFMRPTGFMSNALGWVGSIKATGNIFGAYGDTKSSPIHPVDIAAASVKVLLDGEKHFSKAYALSGGELLSMPEQAQTLAQAVGREIRYVEVPDEKLRENMLAAGRPAAMVDAVVELMRWVRSTGGGTVSPDVQALLGRAPLTWAQWCKEHAGAFRA